MNTQDLHILIFEDEEIASNFSPLALTRPVFDILAGPGTLLENHLRVLGSTACSLFVRDHLRGITARRHPGHPVNPDSSDQDVLFLNGSSMVSPATLKRLMGRKEPFRAIAGTKIIAAMAPRREASRLLRDALRTGRLDFNTASYPRQVRLPQVSLLEYPWQLIALNPKFLAERIPLLPLRRRMTPASATILGHNDHVYVEEGASFEKPSVLDARGGPIFVGRGTEVRAFTRISGPAYIGRHTILRSALVGEGCTVMDHCRLGGELEQSILSGYSNKQHSSFLGHSYVGQWVNIGALTANSDLKNTYGSIRMDLQDRRIDTGMEKVGCFLADYSKTSIGTQIYAGKRIGVASQVHGGVYDDVPSFTIYTRSVNGKVFQLDIDSAIKTQERMMTRRGVKMAEEEVALIKNLFEATRTERRRAGVVSKRLSFT